MKITFRDRKLEKLANDDRKRLAAMGKKRSDRFNLRMVDLMQAENLEDVRHLPGNFHELTSPRKGQWACDLDQPYRLIFTPHEDPIPTDADGKYIWVEILGVEIIEIVDYHK